MKKYNNKDQYNNIYKWRIVIIIKLHNKKYLGIEIKEYFKLTSLKYGG